MHYCETIVLNLQIKKLKTHWVKAISEPRNFIPFEGKGASSDIYAVYCIVHSKNMILGKNLFSIT